MSGRKTVKKKAVTKKTAKKKSTQVLFADTLPGVNSAVHQVFDHFGGAKKLLKKSGDVYLKVNAIDLKMYSYTDPEVIRAVIQYFKDGGARNIYVIENCTQGNFTRLVLRATGMEQVCRETGAIPVYLDETDSVPVYLEGVEQFVDISSFVYEKLILESDQNLYVSLPKLKTHSMTEVTLSIKNQFGLVHQFSRIVDHNFRLHQKFADIYQVIRPDFALVDGLVATNHGHYIAEKNKDECIVPMNCLIGGPDPMAVDVVGASFIGYALKDVKHLTLAAKKNLGESKLSNIEIVNKEIYSKRKKKLTHQLLGKFPPDVTILRGKERCCREGCRRNTETCMEVFYTDYEGKGGFTVLMGKGIDPKAVAKIEGPVHIAGSCAIQDYGMELEQRLGKGRLTMSHGCNNLAETIHGLSKHMKVSTLELAGVNPFTSLGALIQARLHKTKANIPPVF